MQEKQKVTLYLPQPLHRQLKIRAAVETEAMSSLVERAVSFYLNHSDVVDEYKAPHGQTHRVYACPACQSPSTICDGELVSLNQNPSILDDGALTIERAATLTAPSPSSPESQGGTLIPC
ncbi:MAG: hypothetical protein Fur0042_12090 [Cyanophyceae cyanobacterium]